MPNQIIRLAQKVEKIFSDICKEQIDSVSVFTVGSLVEPYCVRYASDLDLRVVVKNPRSKQIAKIMQMMSEVAEDINTNTLAIQAGFRVGIQRIDSYIPSLLLHIIFLAEDDLHSLPKTHLRGYASKYKILDGKDLLSTYRDMALSANEVVYAAEGIEDCISMLRASRLKYLEWNLSEDQAFLESKHSPMSDFYLWECIKYAVNKCTQNAGIAVGYSEADSIECLSKSFDLYSEYSDLIQSIIGKEVPLAVGAIQIDMYRRKAISYLDSLKQLLHSEHIMEH